jgi:hypothetical protein
MAERAPVNAGAKKGSLEKKLLLKKFWLRTFLSGKLPGKWFRCERAEGICTRGAEGTKGEEGALSGRLPAEGAEGA